MFSASAASALPAWIGAQAEQTPREGEAAPARDEDAELMMAVAQGDESALAQLIRKWQGPLINFFYRSLGSVEQAEDLTQLVFVRVYRAAATYQPVARFSTYLFHIARRLLINEFRRRQRKPLEMMDPADLRAVDTSSGRDQQRMFELEEAFQQALTKLTEDQRTAILLLKQQELSYEEIAEIMKQSVAAVKTHIFRGRQKLKEILRKML
ncbi:MAG TPA: RNA polymerase sigma factor [Opitutales bacterium]|nr:RNA polymerase sigma factor [Opitutales bacterium]